MSDFVISRAAVTGSEMVELVDSCQNTTVGPNKYQLYCVTASNLDGDCTLLPAKYTSIGKLDCLEVTDQPFLRELYNSNGLACAINCYYPLGTTLPTLSIRPLPSLSIPSFSVPSYTYPSISFTLPTPSPGPVSGTGNNNGISNNGGDNNPLTGPIGGSDKLSAGLTTDANLMFTFMAVLAVMLLFVRRAI